MTDQRKEIRKAVEEAIERLNLWTCPDGHISSVHRPEKQRCFFCGKGVERLRR